MRHYLINPTWRCQNKCSYCWMQQTVMGRPELVGAPERSVEDWYRALKRDQPELVDIAGGEPLLLPWVPDLMRVASSIRFGLSTNGLHLPGIADLCRSRIENLVNINVSYHPETRVPGYAERWQGAVLRLLEAGYTVHPNIIAYGSNREATRDVRGWMEQKAIGFAISPYEEMDDLGTRMEQGLLCEGGVNHLTVAPDGTAWPCLTKLRSPYWAETALGNWIDGTVDLAKKEQPCHLNCTDYYVLSGQHEAGDMWQVCARPA